MNNILEIENRFSHLAKMLCVDKIVISHDRYIANDPDYKETARSWSFFGGYTEKEKDFWCPKVDWWINGKHYFGLIPMCTYKKIQRNIFSEQEIVLEDSSEMMKCLMKMIKETKNNE